MAKIKTFLEKMLAKEKNLNQDPSHKIK